MQYGFDFSGLKDELGSNFDAFVQRWEELGKLSEQRAHNALKMGRILRGLCDNFGAEWVQRVLKNSKAPSWRAAQRLMLAFDWLGDLQLTPAQLLVLDEIIYSRCKKDEFAHVVKWLKEGKSADEIDALLTMLKPPSGGDIDPPASITEEDVRLAYVRMLQDEGWIIETGAEARTADNGRVDILAKHPDGEMLLVECKLHVDRGHAIEALGQLTLYSQTFRNRIWHIAYWSRDELGDSIMSATAGIVQWRKVSLTTATA